MNIAELSFVSILVVMVAFYLITIRPAQQEQKRHEQTIRDLQVGDDVLTTSGFYARIKDIQTPEQGPVQIVLDIGNGVEVHAVATAIIERITPAEQTAEQPEHPTKGS